MPLVRRSAVLAMLLAAPSAAFALDCENPVTQLDMNQCAAQDYQEADAELNDTYGKLMQALGGNADVKALLKTAQRDWIAFRDAECAFAGSGTAGGSISPMVKSECLTDLTEARTQQLQDYLDCPEGDVSCAVDSGD